MTEVKILTLFKNMVFAPAGSGGERLYRYESTVTKKTLAPEGPLLTAGVLCGRAVTAADRSENTVRLEKGKYLFIQYAQDQREKAAEALWLESLWLDIDLETAVYERVLEEDGKTVFQLFRKITGKTEEAD